MPEIIISTSQFLGIEAGLPVDRLSSNFLTVADNVYVDGAAPGLGGVLKARPGKRAQWNTTLGSRIYASTIYYKANADRYLVFAAGDGTNTNGWIYTWKRGDAAPVLIMDLGMFRETETQFAQLGDYIFISGNTDRKLRRYNLTDAEVADGLATPTYAPTAILNSSGIGDLATVSAWKTDTISSTDMMVLSNKFIGAATSGGTMGLPDWDEELVIEATAAGYDSLNPTWQYCRLDEPNSAIETSATINNSLKENDNDVSPADRFAQHVAITIRMQAKSLSC